MVIGIEACGASHHWARILRSFGHVVKLIAPQLVKPYGKRGKNDTADAEALCEAISRPAMRFVPVKTAEQQAALMMAGLRDRLAGAGRPGSSASSSANRRSWPPWRWPTQWPASPGS
jgi:transposase